MREEQQLTAGLLFRGEELLHCGRSTTPPCHSPLYSQIKTLQIAHTDHTQSIVYQQFNSPLHENPRNTSLEEKLSKYSSIIYSLARKHYWLQYDAMSHSAINALCMYEQQNPKLQCQQLNCGFGNLTSIFLPRSWATPSCSLPWGSSFIRQLELNCFMSQQKECQLIL